MCPIPQLPSGTAILALSARGAVPMSATGVDPGRCRCRSKAPGSVYRPGDVLAVAVLKPPALPGDALAVVLWSLFIDDVESLSSDPPAVPGASTTSACENCSASVFDAVKQFLATSVIRPHPTATNLRSAVDRPDP